MSKILLINGSPNEHGCTYTALKEIADTLSRNEVESEFLYFGKKPMAGCIDCGKCSGTGRCVQLCAFLDRLFYCSESRMAGKLAASVVSCRRVESVLLLTG